MKKILIFFLVFLFSVALFAQEKENKLELGCRGYTIFNNPLFGNESFIDYKSNLGVGFDFFVNKNIIEKRLFLNIGLSLEMYSHKFFYRSEYINYPSFYQINFLSNRPSLGIEYLFIHHKLFTSCIILGSSISQQYLQLNIKINNEEQTSSFISKEEIKEHERKFIYPYAMLKCSYSIKEKYHVGLFIKANFYPDASFSDNITEEDLRLSTGLEFRF